MARIPRPQRELAGVRRRSRPRSSSTHRPPPPPPHLRSPSPTAIPARRRPPIAYTHYPTRDRAYTQSAAAIAIRRPSSLAVRVHPIHLPPAYIPYISLAVRIHPTAYISAARPIPYPPHAPLFPRSPPPMPAQISSDDSDRRVALGALRGARRPSPSRTAPTGLAESYHAHRP
ncbi:hypothetical protein EV714DRAFT_278227 [Schizophyllum commune]